MRAWMLLVAMVGVGCDRILGFETIGPPIDAAIDVPGPIRSVTGRISQLFVHADASALPATTTVPYPPNAITLEYVTDMGSMNLEVDSAGNFAFMAPTGTYRLALTVQGDPAVRDLVFSSDTLNIQAAILTRPDAVPVTGATIHANLVLTEPVLFSTGIWVPEVLMFSSGPANAYVANWTYDKLEAARGDRVYAIEYLNPPSPPQAANYINAVAPGMVTLMDGQPAFVAGPVVRYDTSHGCLEIEPEFDAAFQRLGTAIQTVTKRHEWSVSAVPSDVIAPVPNGMRIAYDDNTVASNAPIENPFGLPLLAMSSVASDRNYGPTALTSSLSEWHEVTVPPVGCPVEQFDTIEAPIASSPTLGGTALGAEDTKVDRAGRSSLDLTWEPMKAGTGWEIELAEVGTQPTPALIHVILTDQTRVKIPSSLLVPGRSYVFTLSSSTGLTNAAFGDFESASFPFATASVVSHAFSVL